MRKWLSVNVGLGNYCVTSPWLFNVNGGSFEINQLLIADDTALAVDSEEKLCRLVSEFGRVCERRKLRVN